MKLNTDCYKCQHRAGIPGDYHSRCLKPDEKMEGSPHGIENGWFCYPYNFDPIWMKKECSNYEPKEQGE